MLFSSIFCVCFLLAFLESSFSFFLKFFIHFIIFLGWVGRARWNWDLLEFIGWFFQVLILILKYLPDQSNKVSLVKTRPWFRTKTNHPSPSPLQSIASIIFPFLQETFIFWESLMHFSNFKWWIGDICSKFNLNVFLKKYIIQWVEWLRTFGIGNLVDFGGEEV